MNDAKYIGLDVHQAQISGGGLGVRRQFGDGSYSQNESRSDTDKSRINTMYIVYAIVNLRI